MIYHLFSIQISRAFGINSGLKVSLQSKMYSLSCRVPRSGHLGNYPLHLLSNGGVGWLENLLIQSLSKKQVLHEHPVSVTPASAAPELIFYPRDVRNTNILFLLNSEKSLHQIWPLCVTKVWRSWSAQPIRLVEPKKR